MRMYDATAILSEKLAPFSPTAEVPTNLLQPDFALYIYKLSTTKSCLIPERFRDEEVSSKAQNADDHQDRRLERKAKKSPSSRFGFLAFPSLQVAGGFALGQASFCVGHVASRPEAERPAAPPELMWNRELGARHRSIFRVCKRTIDTERQDCRSTKPVCFVLRDTGPAWSKVGPNRCTMLLFGAPLGNLAGLAGPRGRTSSGP